MQRIKTVTPTRLRNAAPAGSTAVLIHPDVIGLILLSASSQSANGEDFCEESKGLLLRAKLVCRAWRKTARLRLMEVSGGFLRRMNAMRESAEARDVAGIIGGMQFFLGHAGVQSTCCEALLALTPTPGDEEWRFIPQDEGEDEELADVMMHNVFAYLVDCGVVAALREAVRAHTDAEAVLRPALKMLNLLASSEDEDIAEEIQEDIALQGSVVRTFISRPFLLASVLNPPVCEASRSFTTNQYFPHAQMAQRSLSQPQHFIRFISLGVASCFLPVGNEQLQVPSSTEITGNGSMT